MIPDVAWTLFFYALTSGRAPPGGRVEQPTVASSDGYCKFMILNR